MVCTSWQYGGVNASSPGVMLSSWARTVAWNAIATPKRIEWTRIPCSVDRDPTHILHIVSLNGARVSLVPPPVLVMNLHYTGIGIGRSLHPLGIPVDGLSAEDDAPGARSRWFRRVHQVPHGRVAPEALCEKLLAIRRHYDDAPVIFPTGDADVLFLAEFAHRLEPHYRLPPGRDALPRLMDKASLAATAELHDIETPKTA